MPNQTHKVCPKCGQPAVLTMQTCQRCGHGYRTQFNDQTQVFDAPSTSSGSTSPSFQQVAKNSFFMRPLRFFGCCLATVALFLGLIVIGALLGSGHQRSSDDESRKITPTIGHITPAMARRVTLGMSGPQV